MKNSAEITRTAMSSWYSGKTVIQTTSYSWQFLFDLIFNVLLEFFILLIIAEILQLIFVTLFLNVLILKLKIALRVLCFGSMRAKSIQSRSS